MTNEENSEMAKLPALEMAGNLAFIKKHLHSSCQ